MASELLLVLPIAAGLGAVLGGRAAPIACSWPSFSSGALKQRLFQLGADLPGRWGRAAGLILVGGVTGIGAVGAYAAQPPSAPRPAPAPALAPVAASRPIPVLAMAAPVAPVAARPSAMTAADHAPPTVVTVAPSTTTVSMSECRPISPGQRVQFVPPQGQPGPDNPPTCRDLDTQQAVPPTLVATPVLTGPNGLYISTNACIATRAGQVAMIAAQDGNGLRKGDCYDQSTGQVITRTVVNYGLPPATGIVGTDPVSGVVNLVIRRNYVGPYTSEAASTEQVQ